MTVIQVPAATGSDNLLLAQTMVKCGEPPVTVDQMQKIIADDEDKRLH
jgi:hypothetical protein